MRIYPAKTVTIYYIPQFVAEAQDKTFTQQIISSGFQCMGLSLYNDSVFSELDFAASCVNDRPEPYFKEAEERYVFPDEPVS